MNLRPKKPSLAKKLPSGGPAPLDPPAAPQGETTTRAELLNAVYTACPSLSRAQARDVFEMTLEEIVSALLRGESVAENARLQRLERMRTRLLADETMLTEIANTWPGADITHLRQLRRNALKEQEANKPPKNFRAIYQVLKELDDLLQKEKVEDAGE